VENEITFLLVLLTRNGAGDIKEALVKGFF
jgi:hypothetical protein